MAGTPYTVYLLLGSNIANREDHLKQARERLAAEVRLITASSVFETASWGDRDQDSYLNQALMIETSKTPEQLHRFTRFIERAMGRTEKGNYKPRTIDIDILFFADDVMDSHKLIIPHPRIPIRRFVLTPMQEIAPDLVHPILNQTITELLETCPDQLEVNIYNE